MNQGQMAFSRIMEHGSRFVLDRCIRRYDGNGGVRRFSVRDQYLAMSFAHMTFRDSLRDIEACLGSAPDTLCHLGTRGTVARSTLADRGPALLHPFGCHHLLPRQLHALAPGRGIQAGGDPPQRVPSTQVRKTGCPQSGKMGDNLLHPGLGSGPPGPGESDRVFRRPQSLRRRVRTPWSEVRWTSARRIPSGSSPTPGASSGDSPQAFAPGTVSLQIDSCQRLR